MTETVQEIQKDGDLSRRIGVSQDTGKDEFYQLAGTFDGMLESLEQAFSQGTAVYIGRFSHELRTPVSVILAQCEASLNRTDLSEEQRKEISSDPEKSRRNVSDDLSASVIVTGRSGAAAVK